MSRCRAFLSISRAAARSEASRALERIVKVTRSPPTRNIPWVKNSYSPAGGALSWREKRYPETSPSLISCKINDGSRALFRSSLPWLMTVSRSCCEAATCDVPSPAQKTSDQHLKHVTHRRKERDCWWEVWRLLANRIPPPHRDCELQHSVTGHRIGLHARCHDKTWSKRHTPRKDPDQSTGSASAKDALTSGGRFEPLLRNGSPPSPDALDRHLPPSFAQSAPSKAGHCEGIPPILTKPPAALCRKHRGVCPSR